MLGVCSLSAPEDTSSTTRERRKGVYSPPCTRRSCCEPHPPPCLRRASLVSTKGARTKASFCSFLGLSARCALLVLCAPHHPGDDLVYRIKPSKIVEHHIPRLSARKPTAALARIVLDNAMEESKGSDPQPSAPINFGGMVSARGLHLCPSRESYLYSF